MTLSSNETLKCGCTNLQRDSESHPTATEIVVRWQNKRLLLNFLAREKDSMGLINKLLHGITYMSKLATS